jgi:hypothetical protein
MVRLKWGDGEKSSRWNFPLVVAGDAWLSTPVVPLIGFAPARVTAPALGPDDPVLKALPDGAGPVDAPALASTDRIPSAAG